MSDFITAIGLVLIIEGVFYGGFPQFAKRAIAQVLDMDDSVIRLVGTICAVAGLALIWLTRG